MTTPDTTTHAGKAWLDLFDSIAERADLGELIDPGGVRAELSDLVDTFRAMHGGLEPLMQRAAVAVRAAREIELATAASVLELAPSTEDAGEMTEGVNRLVSSVFKVDELYRVLYALVALVDPEGAFENAGDSIEPVEGEQ